MPVLSQTEDAVLHGTMGFTTNNGIMQQQREILNISRSLHMQSVYKYKSVAMTAGHYGIMGHRCCRPHV